jgi:hypothetical protein
MDIDFRYPKTIAEVVALYKYLKIRDDEDTYKRLGYIKVTLLKDIDIRETFAAYDALCKIDKDSRKKNEYV